MGKEAEGKSWASDGPARVTVDAVLFDFHNTTLDGSYAAAGIAHVGDLLSDRLDVGPNDFEPAFMRGVGDAMTSYVELDFYLMHDVFVDAIGHATRSFGLELQRDELVLLEREMWRVNISASRPVDGAADTIDALRASGVKVGIVSWADEDVFDSLMDRLDFDRRVDVAVCSETARSCKPHPGIFRWALDALDASPTHSMFVGDSIDGDIVGGNRLGMTTALVDASRFSQDVDAFGDDPMTIPDFRIPSVRQVLDIVEL